MFDSTSIVRYFKQESTFFSDHTNNWNCDDDNSQVLTINFMFTQIKTRSMNVRDEIAN